MDMPVFDDDDDDNNYIVTKTATLNLFETNNYISQFFPLVAYYLEGLYTKSNKFLNDQTKIIISCSLVDLSHVFKQIVQSYVSPIEFKVVGYCKTKLGAYATRLKLVDSSLCDQLAIFNNTCVQCSAGIDIWSSNKIMRQRPKWFVWDSHLPFSLFPGESIWARYSSSIMFKK